MSSPDAAGLTIHVRLIEGEDSEHVLVAIFKALGVALARAAGDDHREELMAEKDVIRTEARRRRSRARPTTRRSGSAISSSSPVSSGSASTTAALAGDGVAEQTEQVMANLGAILEAAGSGSTSS